MYQRTGLHVVNNETKHLDDIPAQRQPLLKLNPLKTLAHCLGGLKTFTTLIFKAALEAFNREKQYVNFFYTLKRTSFPFH